MKMLLFAKRNIKEMLRDPLTLAMGLGFPVILLLLLSAIQASIPVPLFEIQHLTPGMIVFGLSFLTLFTSLTVAKDRSSSFLRRLYTTPLRAVDFILGYTLPSLPLALCQGVACYLVALALGLAPSVNILFCLLFQLIFALPFIGFGLIFGTLLNEKQVGGIAGALFTNVTAFLSGAWFDLTLVGGGFLAVAEALPFVHATEIGRAILLSEYAAILPHLPFILIYGAITIAVAVLLFLRQMKSE